MGCWKWFNSVLEEANVTVTDKNKAKIDDVIHKYYRRTIQQHSSQKLKTFA